MSAVLAGACIAFGGVAFLSVENSVLGALFFTAGLFCVCTFGLKLFTGKVCYVFKNGRGYALELPVVWLGNFAGTMIVAALVRLSRIAAISARAAEMCAVKLGDTLPSLFILGIMCNIFIYIAVEGFNEGRGELGKYLALFFGVTVFILCSYEHCVADMFYFSAAGMWSGKAFGRIVIITLGNAVGGVLFPLARSFIRQ